MKRDTNGFSSSKKKKKGHGHSHGHSHSHKHGEDEEHGLSINSHKEKGKKQTGRARKALIIATCFTLFFMIIEITGGYIAGSLAIMTDAAHLVISFSLSFSLTLTLSIPMCRVLTSSLADGCSGDAAVTVCNALSG